MNGWTTWKTAFALGVAVILLWFLYRLQSIILLAVLAALLGLLFDVIARFAMRWVKIPRGAAVVLAGILFLIGLAGTLVLLAVPVAREVNALLEHFPQDMTNLTEKVDQYRQEFPWLRHILPSGTLPLNAPGAEGPKPIEVAKSAFFTASTALEWGAEGLGIFFLAIFLAWDPQRWLNGIAGFWPKSRAPAIKELLQQIASSLRSYFFTMAIYMLTMGALWTIGLWIIGLEYPLLFGMIGGLVEIVPYIGPMIGLIPPLIYAITLGPLKVLSVVILYVILHVIEGYILVPYLLHQQEHLPPPLIVLSILAFGSLFGLLGVIVAVPLGIAGYVWANETVYKDREKAG